MIKIKRMIILFFVFALLIAGCNAAQSGSSGGSSGGSFLPSFGSSSKKTPEINVYVGTSGLTAEFAKTAPPPRVFERSSFPILIRVRNIGAYSIGQDGQTFGVLSIGRERDYIPQLVVERDNKVLPGTTDNEAFFSIDGKTQINPQGDEIIVSINAKTGKLDPQSENKQSTLTATLCYPYKTILSTTVCIDPDVAGIRPGKKACTVKDIVFNSGQGAPIAITKIEPQMIPEVGKDPSSKTDVIKPQFLIFVENKGRGISVDNFDKQSYASACTKKDDPNLERLWNIADIRVYTTPSKDTKEKIIPGKGVQLICCPNVNGQCPDQEPDISNDEKITGYLRFKDKKDFVRCTFKNGIKRTDDAYTSPLRIEIDYGYVQTISTNFFIQKPLKY